MKLKSAFLYAKKIIFSQGSQKTVGTKSIKGAILCIALSLIPLVVVVSVSDAMINGMTERLINLSSSHIQLQFMFSNDEIIDKQLMDDCLDRIKKIDGVTDAYELITTTGLVSSLKARCGATIKACDPEIFKDIKSYKSLFSITDGNIEDFYSEENKTALIGKEISEKLQLKPGDSIRLITTQKVNDKILPKISVFKIAGIVSCGYQELDSLWVFIPMKYGIEILKSDTSLSSIMIETAYPFSKNGELYALQQRVEAAADFNANCYRWDELNASQFENFSSTRILLVFIMLLIVLVACVNISSCIVMLLMERRKEIAILKSFGTDNSTITMSFILVGLLIGSAGIIIGIPAGIIIAVNVNNLIFILEQAVNLFARLGYFMMQGNLDSFFTIHLFDEAYYLDSIPVSVPYIQILFYIIATLILSLLTSFIPAWKAGREKTIETFRKAGS